MTEVTLPPLFTGRKASSGEDPFVEACGLADDGCNGGTIVYYLGETELSAALILAPEIPLKDAMVMLPVCGVGFQNALGSLAPPEVAVQLRWTGEILLNGGECGRFDAAASLPDPEAVPDWLVVALSLCLWPESEDTGLTPNQTALYAEGCSDVQPGQLLEAWARHTLVWLNRWSEEGTGPVHKEWSGLVPDISQDITVSGVTGSFVGVDERFGLLLRRDSDVELIPLTALLKDAA